MNQLFKNSIFILVVLSLFVLSCSKNSEPTPELPIKPQPDTLKKAVFEVVSSALEFEADANGKGSAQRVKITSDTAWSVSSNRDWCKTSVASGKNDTYVDVMVVPNSNDTVRLAVVTFSSGAKIVEVKVSQKHLVAEKDRRALINFYKETTGEVWENATNWNTKQPIGTWHGVKVNENGNVISLDMSNNGLWCSELPERMTDLEYLEELIITKSKIGQNIPEWIANFKHLRVLNLSENGKLTGKIPARLAELKNLEVLNLARNNINDVFPQWIAECPKLKSLNFNYCALEGTIPASIGQLKDMTTLNLYANLFTGKMPDEIYKLTKLTELNLGDNKFMEWKMSDNIGNLVSLKVLDLSDAKTEGAINPAIGKLKELTTLNLKGCAFTGTLPGELGNLTKLTRLNLSANSITGAIPSNVSNLTSLVEVNLSGNKFDANFPEFVFNNPNLENIDLSNASFKGVIPDQFQKLLKLVGLNLSKNKFTGSLPPSVAQIPELMLVKFNNNNMEGAVPQAYKTHKNWTYWSLTPQDDGFKFDE